MRAKLGMYVPVYGGWLRNVPLEEKEVNYQYAKRVTLKGERIGIESIWVPDHLLNPIKGENGPSLEAWTTLTALASETRKVELFHTTLCQAFRHPAVLAKMCATLSDISEGRFQINLGAGWLKREFEAYGLSWHEHDDRIDRGREQLEIVRGLLEKSVFNYKGKYYQIQGGILEPKPRKRIPIWWTGESEKSRELVADLADGWLIGNSTPKQLREKITDMNRRLEKRGKTRIKYAVPGHLFVDKTDEKTRNEVRTLLHEFPSVLKWILDTGYVGSPETIADRIRNTAEAGADYIIFQTAPTLEALDTLRDMILPLL